ncbi:3,4-dihydroxy-2-butanone-4-phosphate synthase [Psychrobacter sp. NG25]|nr:3,4-dihydroxy-2-butanone-4-phosphate synthase [Psychrobacter sp. NG25]
MNINTIPEIIEDIKAGKMVIIMDDEDRENEGDLIMAASLAKPDDINFMITHARGLVCLTLTSERCKKLKLPLMCKDNQAPYSTNFTVSIDAAKGVSTGISTADRAQTIRTAVSQDVTFDDVVTPGHIFPLVAKEGGVLERAGHTEAGCDLTRLAGLEPAAVIVEIINQDGKMARRNDLMKFADTHNLKVGTIDALIKYIKSQETVESIDKVENFEETVTYEYDESDERTVELI